MLDAHDDPFDEMDDDADDEDAYDEWLKFGEDDCGRWSDGKLGQQCRLAGTEDCDWECPIGLPSRQGPKR